MYDPLGVNQPAASEVSGGDEGAPAPRSPYADASYLTIEAYLYQCAEMLVDPRPPRACLPGITNMPTRADVDELFAVHKVASYLPYADFTLYNEAYHNNADHDSCVDCNGKAGTLEGDTEGDGVYATYITRLNPCDDCIGAGLCPGCMQPLAYTFDYSAFGEDRPIVKRATGWYYASNSDVKTIEVITPPAVRADGYEGQTYGVYEYDAYQLTADEATADIYLYSWFSCTVCGWAYDAERHNNYYDDSGDYDYPALDADQMFY